MPVKAFIGLQRQGKSYSAMKYAVLPMLKAGRKVITSIAVTDKALEEFPNLEYQKEINYKDIHAGAVYVLDEVWKECPKGLTTAKLPEIFKEFFAMSGHLVGENDLTTEIIIITQNFETQLCDYILGQIETTYYVEKVPLTDKINQCRTTTYRGVVKGNPPRAKNEGVKLEKYDPKVFEYYKSNSGSKNGQVAIEMDVIKPKTLMDLKIVKYGIPLGVIAIFLIIYFGSSLFGGITGSDKNKIKTRGGPNGTKVIVGNNPASKVRRNIQPVKTARQKEIESFYKFTDELSTFPLSKDKRLTGQFKISYPPKIIKDMWQLTINNQKTIEITANHIKKDIYGQNYLVYRGEIVTEYTGEEPLIYDENYMPDGRSLENKESSAVANVEPVKRQQENSILLDH